MRTPWKFVADLVSRKPKADVTDEHRPHETETPALEYQPAVEEAIEPGSSEQAAEIGQPNETEARPSTPDLIPRPPAETVRTDRAMTAPSVAADEVVSTPATAESANIADVEPQDEPSHLVTTQKTGNPKRNTPANSEEITVRKADASSLSDKPKTIVQEMAALDAEVAVLRRQLSIKLAEQNAQLRKMLERFERS